MKSAVDALAIAVSFLALALQPLMADGLLAPPPGQGAPSMSLPSGPFPAVRITNVFIVGNCLRNGGRIRVTGQGFPTRTHAHLQLERPGQAIPLKTRFVSKTQAEGDIPPTPLLGPGRYVVSLYITRPPRLLARTSRQFETCQADKLAVPSGAPRKSLTKNSVTNRQLPGIQARTGNRPGIDLRPGNLNPPLPPAIGTVPVSDDDNASSSTVFRDNPAPDHDGYDEGSFEQWEDESFGNTSPSSTGGSLMGQALPPPLDTGTAQVNPDSSQNVVPGEFLILSSSMTEARNLARTLSDSGFRVKRRRQLQSMGMVLSVFGFPPDRPVAEVLDEVRESLPDIQTDANGYLEAQGDDDIRQWGLKAIGFHPPEHGTPTTCNGKTRIGLLDGPVDTGHPGLSDAKVVFRDLLPLGVPRVSTDHATAIALILTGKRMKGWQGLVPGKSVFAAGVLRRLGDKRVTTVEWVLHGLDWLVQKQVDVISMSLGTPAPNRLLERGIRHVLDRGIPVVAAAGNGGADAPPSYPAAYDGVMAVTAINADGAVFSGANRGSYIDLAAPGEDVWVPLGGEDGRFVTGTSYAAPYVAAALLHTSPDELLSLARDLGKPGRDNIYGHGLLQWPSCPRK